METSDEQVLRKIKPFVLGWVGEMLRQALDEGLASRAMSLGTERGAGNGDLRMSGSIKKSTPIAARLTRSTEILVPDSAWACLAFDAGPRFALPAHLDLWFPASPSRLVAPVSGVYLVHAPARFAANPTGHRALQLRRNACGIPSGGEQLASVTRQALGGDSCTDLHLTSLALLAASDTLEVFALQNSGGSLSLLAVAEATPEFMLARIA